MIDPKKRKASILSRLFRFSLDEMRAAYEAAREAPNRDKVSLEKRWAKFEEEVAAGEASFTEEDEDGQVIYDYGEHMGEMMAEVRAVQKIIREAFVISLHQLWEREITKYSRITNYKEEKAICFLKDLGFTPDPVGVKALRLVANAAKHGPGNAMEDLYKLRKDFFDLSRMQKDGSLQPDYEYLAITDEHVEELFDTVRRSWN